MAIYELKSDCINKVNKTSFADEGIQERGDLQRLLRDYIEVLSPDAIISPDTKMMIISEEFSQWEDSSRRIDLLGLDEEANLVVIELKRTEDGGHMELQAIRYAAMVSTMTFDQVVEAHEKYLTQRQKDENAREAILEFLEWSEPDPENFAQEVRILLVSADFSKEITTAVMWLNSKDLDIRCIRLQPYDFNGKTLLDVQQLIPLPEASDYIIKVKEKEQIQRASASRQWDEESFMKTLVDKKSQHVADIAKELFDWSKGWSNNFYWGEGARSGSITPVIDRPDNWYAVFVIWTYGTIEIQFQWLRYRDCFKDEAMRLELLEKLNRIEGIDIPADGIDRRPSFAIDLLGKLESMVQFKETVEWAVGIIKNV